MKARIPVQVVFDRRGKIIQSEYTEKELSSEQVDAICAYVLGCILNRREDTVAAKI